MKKLTTRLSEAAAGSGAAVGALQRLGLLGAEGLQALPLDDRLIAIQDTLARMVLPRNARAASRLTSSGTGRRWRSCGSIRPRCARRRSTSATSVWRSARRMPRRSSGPAMRWPGCS